MQLTADWLEVWFNYMYLFPSLVPFQRVFQALVGSALAKNNEPLCGLFCA